MRIWDEREELSAKLEVVKAAKDELFKNDSTQSERLAAIREVNELEGAIDCLAPRYQVGDGISCCGYGDIAPYTVIAVSGSGKRITSRAVKLRLTHRGNLKYRLMDGMFFRISGDARYWFSLEDLALDELHKIRTGGL